MRKIIPNLIRAVIGKDVASSTFSSVTEVNALMLKKHLDESKLKNNLAAQKAAQKKEQYTIDDILAMSEEGTLHITQPEDKRTLYREAADLLESTSNSVSGAKATQVAVKDKTKSY